jgi:ech hydrogenase subunit C
MKSPWLVHFDCGGCNGCDIEILDALTPRHSAERFGVINVGDPRQGDVLVVTGPANRRNAHVLRTVYDQMSEPKAVLAVGSCAAHGGIFRGAPNILGGVGDIVPVDAYVSGCPPTPEKILAGVIEAIPLLAERRPEREPGGAPAPGETPDEPVLVTHPHAQLDDARWTAWSGPAGSAPRPLPVLAQSSPEEAPDGDAG